MSQQPMPRRLTLIAAAAAVAAVASPTGQIPVPQSVVPAIAVPRGPVVLGPGAAVESQAELAPPQNARRPLTPARAEAYVQAARLGLDYLPGEVIVKFRSGVGPAGQARVLGVLDGRPSVGDLEWHGPVAVIRDESEPDAWALAARLAAQPEVEYAEPNFIGRVWPIEAIDPPGASFPAARVATSRASTAFLRTNATPTDADYNAYQWNFGLINMPGAWDIQPGGRSDIIVAVVDTGITTSAQTLSFSVWTGAGFEVVPMVYGVNPDLPASRLVSPRDFVFLGAAGPVVDMDGHGTHVSGTVAQETNNGLLVAGIAYRARVMPVKVCTGYWEVMIARAQAGTTGFAPSDAGSCPFAAVADGVRYAADNGAKVINISLGGSSPSTTLRDALIYAVNRGAFIAISMGNDFENGNPVKYPARYAADINGAMAVAAVGKARARAFYSSTGAHCEIAAPGGDSRQADGGLDAGRVWQSTLRLADITAVRPRFDGYDKRGFSGTSMAAPHVAGLAALLMSQMPGISPARVEEIITKTARDLGQAGRDDQFGYGLIDARAALFGQAVR